MSTTFSALVSTQATSLATPTRISFQKPALVSRTYLSFNLRRSIPTRLSVSCAAKPETVDKVSEIVRKQPVQLSLKPEQKVVAETKFAELGADSLDTVEIVMGLEEAFGIEMAEEKAQKIATVEEAAELIEDLVLLKK
ncbi:hypothetical protein Rs2_32371 [Raphanus sativus]|uniref:Acyl carrier protein n=1 Tax=Raphanus sativus TaxID=3726 RepID=A0A6J0KAM0_RAPSA|nr:acyl carrier protein, chloroplastic [Raphanus sativus]KAJ4882278.1 hypothetical protein Rs2_32371 [Raphanus sativus]